MSWKLVPHTFLFKEQSRTSKLYKLCRISNSKTNKICQNHYADLLGGSFRSRQFLIFLEAILAIEIRTPIQFKREGQPQHLKR